MPQMTKKLLVHDPFIAIQRNAEGKPNPLAIVWEDETLEPQQESVLATLLRGLSYFGRAESWCEARLNPRSIIPNSLPTRESDLIENDGTLQNLLCAEPGITIEQLMVETSELQKSGYNRPPGSVFLSYRNDKAALSAGLQKYKRPSKPKHAAVYLMQASVLPKPEEMINIATWSRIAVNGRYGQQNDGSPSSCFTGKKEGAARRDQHQHAFFFAESSTVRQNGELDRLIIYSQEGFGEREVRVLQSLRSMPDYRRRSQQKNRSVKSRIRLTPLALLNEQEATREFGVSRVWISKTPYLCGRHPKKHRDHPCHQIQRECERRGLGEVNVVEDEAQSRDFLKKWRASQLKRWGKPAPPDRPRFFTLTFEKAITGPLLLGASSHFGMGRFVPVNVDE